MVDPDFGLFRQDSIKADSIPLPAALPEPTPAQTASWSLVDL